MICPKILVLRDLLEEQEMISTRLGSLSFRPAFIRRRSFDEINPIDSITSSYNEVYSEDYEWLSPIIQSI